MWRLLLMALRMALRQELIQETFQGMPQLKVLIILR